MMLEFVDDMVFAVVDFGLHPSDRASSLYRHVSVVVLDIARGCTNLILHDTAMLPM